MITMMMLLCYVNLSGMSLECIVIVLMNNSLLGGQTCTDSVNIQRSGFIIGHNRLAIVPHFNFTCDGRITSIRARVFFMNDRSEYPFFQVWRPASFGSTIYNKIGEVPLQSDDQLTNSNNNLIANIILTGDNTIEFQSGDVVGYYQPPNTRYEVAVTSTNDYELNWFNGSPASNSADLSERDGAYAGQPLLQFTIGMNCV